MRKPLKWAIGLPILSLPLVAAAWIFVAMNGGISSILLNLKSRPGLDSPELKRDRTKLAQQIDAAFSREIPNQGFFHYETSMQDTCYDGANNWKHRDGFAHRCTLRVTNFYGFDGEFGKTMLDFESGISAAGWHSNIHDMKWTLTGYDAAAPNHQTVDRLPDPYPYYKDGGTRFVASIRFETDTGARHGLDQREQFLRPEKTHRCRRGFSRRDAGPSISIGRCHQRSLFRKLGDVPPIEFW
jgi:hypothetical protein